MHLNRKPPLGFFKDFVMENDGRHHNSINLKRRGTAPLADLIRVHALSHWSQPLKTQLQRLDDIIEAGILPKSKGSGFTTRDGTHLFSAFKAPSIGC